MRLIDKDSIESPYYSMEDITEVGSLWRVVDHKDNHEDYRGMILLRTYNNWVALNNPEHTWPVGSTYRLSFNLSRLPVGYQVTLEQE